MIEHVESFTKKLSEAIAIGEASKMTVPENEIRNILVTGLGGSGIGGTVLAQILEQHISIPILVCKDYFIPTYVNKHTLVIVSSYSGNTEETLQALGIALERKAKIVCVSGGGKAIEIAKANNLDHILIPPGMPPRACFPYSFTQLFYVLIGLKLIDADYNNQLKNALSLLNAETENIKRDAKKLADELFGKTIVIYSAANYEGVCVRFRQQINENSKLLCWHAAIPEMNHNELVGWVDKNESLGVIFFRNSDDFYRTQKRMEFVKEVVANCTPHIHEVWSKGATQLDKAFYFVLFGDWVSVYLAALKNVDATEVRVIDKLKNSLAAV